MVHHAVKRFQFLLPAIFFKLGIAFTMLILVVIVSASNGVVGFMLLVVGLSAVLARFQAVSPVSAAIPYHSPVLAYHRTIQDWDRSDKGHVEISTKPAVHDYSAYINQKYYSPVSSYAGTYYEQKANNLSG